ncbi:MAG: hypothetical protein LQ343_001552 [Gyalolechia ehrenbergii]|nr:MAG: hypothetical protein LQ343_001552 [Gyalolechia ehrenbergii]
MERYERAFRRKHVSMITTDRWYNWCYDCRNYKDRENWPGRPTSTATIWYHAPTQEKYLAGQISTHCDESSEEKEGSVEEVETSGRDQGAETNDASSVNDTAAVEEGDVEGAPQGHEEPDD